MDEVPLQDRHMMIPWIPWWTHEGGDSVKSRYRGTSLTRKRTPLGPYRRPMPRVLGGS